MCPKSRESISILWLYCLHFWWVRRRRSATSFWNQVPVFLLFWVCLCVTLKEFILFILDRVDNFVSTQYIWNRHDTSNGYYEMHACINCTWAWRLPSGIGGIFLLKIMNLPLTLKSKLRIFLLASAGYYPFYVPTFVKPSTCQLRGTSSSRLNGTFFLRASLLNHKRIYAVLAKLKSASLYESALNTVWCKNLRPPVKRH